MIWIFYMHWLIGRIPPAYVYLEPCQTSKMKHLAGFWIRLWHTKTVNSKDTRITYRNVVMFLLLTGNSFLPTGMVITLLKHFTFCCIYTKVFYEAFLSYMRRILEFIKRFLINVLLSSVTSWSPWKHQQTFDFFVFSGGSKGNIEKKWVKMHTIPSRILPAQS